MLSIKSEKIKHATELWGLPITAAAMSIPVVMFNLVGYDINPAFLLAPLIAIAFFLNLGKTGIFYILSAVFGVSSVFIANKLSPDGDLIRHLFALVLIMFAPSFLFLGKMIARHLEIRTIFLWLSIFSSVFVLSVALRIIFLDQDVRIYVGPLGLASMNAEFFGFPVFAAFGVLSLAHLICLQAMIICGTFVGGSQKPLAMAALGLSLFCASFLIIGSDSRSAQFLLAWILGTVFVYALINRSSAKRSAIAMLLIVIASTFGYSRMDESRMMDSIAKISAPAALDESSDPRTGDREEFNGKGSGSYPDGRKSDNGSSSTNGIESVGSAATGNGMVKKADAFATGRVELAIEGFREVVASPLVGNGFSSYGRYASDSEKTQALSLNSSTHIYYLTLIWKGGLIFFIPFVAMLLMNFKNCLAARSHTKASPERFYAWSAVLMAFGPMAMAWDILIVPSAGALAFFIFGMLAARNRG